MLFYADRPGARLRQILTDVLVVVWVWAWIRAAQWLYDLIEKLAVPGQKLEGAGNGIADNLSDAGSRVDNVPAVGDALASPFRGAATAARSLAEAGQDQQDTVRRLALVLSLLLLAVPLGLVLFGWLPLRIRWMRRAGSAAALRRAAAGRDLLALRALTRQPLRRLVPLGPDPVDAWRRGDEAVVDALAALELRSLGLYTRRP
jgi:hypothetical protein